MDDRRLLLLVETIGTQRGWLVTGTTEERLQQLRRGAAWEVAGTVRMLEAAAEIPAAELEEVLQSGVQELENITLDVIAGRIRHIGRRLGTGGPCTAALASDEDARRATARLKALRTPAGLSSGMAARVETLRQRAARVAEGPFHRANCEGPAPILFGWVDGRPVPLFDLLEPSDAE